MPDWIELLTKKPSDEKSAKLIASTTTATDSAAISAAVASETSSSNADAKYPATDKRIAGDNKEQKQPASKSVNDSKRASAELFEKMTFDVNRPYTQQFLPLHRNGQSGLSTRM